MGSSSTAGDGEGDVQKPSEDGSQSKKGGKEVAMAYLMPWIVSLGLFSLVRQIVLAVNNSSIQDALLFVVLPFVAWYLLADANKVSITAPTFTPRFLIATMAITYATYLVRLSSATPISLGISLSISTAALAIVFTKVSGSDPGHIPMGTPPEGGYQVATVTEPQPAGTSYYSGQWQQQAAAKPDVENPHHEQEIGKTESMASALVSGAAASVEACQSQESTPLVEAPVFPPYHHSFFCYECHIWKWPRSKHCRKCLRCTDRFDHHCPAIANCVGRRNHPLFVAMLLGFIAAEFFFVQCSLYYLRSKGLLELPDEMQKSLGFSDPLAGNPLTNIQWFFLVLGQVAACGWLSWHLQALSAEPWLVAIAIFMSFQLTWETPLLAFHCYCACVNLTTNEFATWRKHPLLSVETPPGPGRPFPGRKFVNPYNKGLIRNVKSFFLGKEL